jgi:lambda family phage portal protein
MGLLGMFNRGPSKSQLAATVEVQNATIQSLVRASFDAAKTHENNQRHWAAADGFSADAALSPAVRTKIRNRARYEIANNSYAAGMASTWARDMVGTGPRLQLDLGPDVNPRKTRQVETAFFDWTVECDLAQKLRLSKQAKIGSGEVFGLKTNNRRFRKVQLDVKLLEADQVYSPLGTIELPNEVDGIRFDDDGNPVSYWVAKYHPGSSFSGWGQDGEWLPSEQVLHWFHATRPGQSRGVPEITPALELFAMLRRYTLAVVSAAETAACFAAILKTTMPADSSGAKTLDLFETMPIVRNMAIAAPDGWEPVQMKAEQPTSNHDQFVRRILNEIARCLDMPYIVAAMDSSSANYSSMRGDYQVYRKAIGVERSDVERIWLDPLFYAWLDEATLINGVIPRGLPPFAEWNWSWTWDGFEHVDPKKEAEADALMVAGNMTTLADVCGRRGKDWRLVLRQRAAEKALMEELGLDESDVAVPVAADPEDA